MIKTHWTATVVTLAAALALGACALSLAPTATPSSREPLPGAPPSGLPPIQPAFPSVADAGRMGFSTAGWKTDFAKHTVPLGEIMSGGPPRDGIPPIDQPKFESVSQAAAWLKANEPVIHFAIQGDVRAYPLQILIRHEIVNDDVGGVPVAVTFCPLCNTAIAFDRRLDGTTLDFGTSGNLRHSDLVMWDRQTESWWQQITGEAIVGELSGERLRMLPASIISWTELSERFPEAQVLSRDTGYSRDYGRNPYVGYDRVDQPPFLYQGPLDGRLPPMERVVAVSLGAADAAYPFSLLRERRVAADRVAGRPLVVFFQPGTSSALDGPRIAGSRDVGATSVYSPVVDGRALSFAWQHDSFVDLETGSRWNLVGQATAGPLAGRALEPLVHGNPFWFSWAAFKPTTRIFNE